MRIELDFCLDGHESLTRQDILNQITGCSLEYTILLEDGPAGGNPLLELRGTKEQIEHYLRTVYLAHDLTDIQYYLGKIK